MDKYNKTFRYSFQNSRSEQKFELNTTSNSINTYVYLAHRARVDVFDLYIEMLFFLHKEHKIALKAISIYLTEFYYKFFHIKYRND